MYAMTRKAKDKINRCYNCLFLNGHMDCERIERVVRANDICDYFEITDEPKLDDPAIITKKFKANISGEIEIKISGKNEEEIAQKLKEGIFLIVDRDKSKLFNIKEIDKKVSYL